MAQSPMVDFPPETQSAFVDFPDGVGGTDEVSWVLMDTVLQASNVPVDAIPIGTSEDFGVVGSGVLRAVMNSDVAANRPGFRDGPIYVTQRVSTLFPDFDWELDELLCYVDRLTTASGSNELLVSAGVVDEQTIDADTQGIAVGWTQSSASQDGVSYVQATSASAATIAGVQLQGVFGRFAFGFDGTEYPVGVSAQGLSIDETRSSAPNTSAAPSIRSDPVDCFLYLGIGKRLSDNVNGQEVRVRAYWGKRRKSALPLG